MTHPLNNPTECTPVRVLNAASQPVLNSYRFSDQRIIQHFELAAGKSQSIDQLLGNLGQIVSAQSECLGFWAVQRNPDGDFSSAHYLLAHDGKDGGDALWTVVEEHATEMMNRVVSTRQICSSPIRSESETELVAAPVCVEINAQPNPISLVIIGCFRAEAHSVLRLQWLTGMVSQAIGRWHQHKSLQHQETKTQSLNDTIGLVHSLDKTTSLAEAAMVVANYLRRVCLADQVAISFCQDPNRIETAQLSAISDVEQIDTHGESNKLVAAACAGALIEKQAIVFPPESADHSPSVLALEKYCKANAFESCINLPLLTEDGKTIGAILLAGTLEKTKSESFRQYLDQMAGIIAGHLDVVKRAHRGLRDIAKASWLKVRQANLTKAVVIALFGFGLLMAVPLPYRVNCDSEIQPLEGEIRQWLE